MSSTNITWLAPKTTTWGWSRRKACVATLLYGLRTYSSQPSRSLIFNRNPLPQPPSASIQYIMTLNHTKAMLHLGHWLSVTRTGSLYLVCIVACSPNMNGAQKQRSLVLGAGLYSFFIVSNAFTFSTQHLANIWTEKNYAQKCEAIRNCQSQIVNIDSLSDIHIYSLSTVASEYQLSMDSHGVVDASDNINGFASMITAWTPDQWQL